jgi:hypothetical protein
VCLVLATTAGAAAGLQQQQKHAALQLSCALQDYLIASVADMGVDEALLHGLQAQAHNLYNPMC